MFLNENGNIMEMTDSLCVCARVRVYKLETNN